MKILLAIPSLMPETGGPAYSVSAIRHHLDLVSQKSTCLTRRGQGGENVGYMGLRQFVSNYDIVHNFSTWSLFNHNVAVAAQREKIPYVFCPMGMLQPWALEQKKHKKNAAWLLYQQRDIERATVIHSTSHLEAGNLRKMGFHVPIAVMPHGMDLPVDLPMSTERSRDSTMRTALFLSRLHPKKGLLELVEAWSLLRPSGWRLIIAGPNENNYGAVVADAIARRQLQESIRIVGPVFGDEKAKLFRSADLFVLPTHGENFGLVIPEALSYGVPVITTTGAPWNELQETGSGWWIEQGVQPLLVALADAVGLSPDELHSMGRRGRKLVEEKYSWDVIILKHMKLYNWIRYGEARPDFIVD